MPVTGSLAFAGRGGNVLTAGGVRRRAGAGAGFGDGADGATGIDVRSACVVGTGAGEGCGETFAAGGAAGRALAGLAAPETPILGGVAAGALGAVAASLRAGARAVPKSS